MVPIIRIYESLLTKFCAWLLGNNAWNLATQRVFAMTRLRTLRRSLKGCGERLSVQFPVTITGLDSVSFGEDVSLAAYVHIWGNGGVRIGDRVMIGTHSSITSLTHDYDCEFMFNTILRQPVIIEDDVWIGSNCVILSGVTVGRGAVVGAGSVVASDVKPNSIVVGVPAVHIKFRKVKSDTNH